MNILMMTNTYAPIVGGLERSIAAFAKQLRKQGHKVLIVAPEFKGTKKYDPGVLRVPALQNFNGTDFSVSLPIPALVAEEVKKFRPHIVHAHHPFLMGDMAMRIAGQAHIPLIFTYHTLFDQYTEHFPLNTEAGKKFIVELAAGYANLADGVVAPSESVRDILRVQGVQTPIAVVPTGVDSARLKKGNGEMLRRAFETEPAAFVAGHAGRLSPEKNLDFLTQAVAGFLKAEPKAHFFVVGRGPSMRGMRRFFMAEKVLDRVHFTGMRRGQNLVDAYHAMNVFVFASQSETQGMVVTEAMGAGVPVIAVDAPGVREVVRDGENGLLLAREDAAKFTKAMRSFSKLSLRRRKKMIQAALATALEFSMEKSADKISRFYEQAKARKYLLRRLRSSPWHAAMRRIKTEWDMLGNLGKAAGTALVETVLPPAGPPQG